MADELYVPQVDYTSRDYTSIREDLIGLIPNFAPQWTSRDSSDFGIVLLELFSYMGDLINYQIDRAANESFIDTATQRSTVIKLANLLGYIPNSGTAAKGNVTITNNSGLAVTIPVLTTLSVSSNDTGSSIDFTLDSAVTSLASLASTTVAVTQGTISSGIYLGASDGSKSQVFALPDTGVFTNSADTSMSILVGLVTYSKKDYLIDWAATDPVFVTYTDGDGVSYVKFGDGISGKIPPKGSTITIVYRYSTVAPSLGNIAAGTLTSIATTANVTVTNALAFSGGSDAESTDSIRVNAPKSLRDVNRAVSLSDYATMALKTSGVAKANAIASSLASVVLYIAATDGAAASTSLLANVSNTFTNKMPPSTTLTVSDFLAAYPYLNVTVAALPQFTAANVKEAVTQALYSLFAFDNVSFNDLITEGDIYAACKAVEGVSYITVNDYEKLTANPFSASKIYSQTGSVSASSSGTTVTLATGNSGIFVGSVITSVNGSITNTSVNRTITAVTSSGTSLTLNSAAAFSTNDIIVVKGANGLVAGSRDFSCAVTEIPILETSYITVSTTGGV